MRTELIGTKLPLHEATLLRRRAADLGLSKSAYAANLIVRGLQAESEDRAPALIDQLQQAVETLKQLTDLKSANATGLKSPGPALLDPRLHAFMIEVLLLLRYLAKDDLRVKGEIGRKVQRAVGDVRVEGT